MNWKNSAAEIYRGCGTEPVENGITGIFKKLRIRIIYVFMVDNESKWNSQDRQVKRMDIKNEQKLREVMDSYEKVIIYGAKALVIITLRLLQ